MEIQTEMKLICLVGNFNNNIEVGIDKGSLELRIDKKKLFQTLKERKTIVGLINKKLDGLVEEHLIKLAKGEEERNNDL